MVISIVNNKGGVLKTTLATNIAAAFSLNNSGGNNAEFLYNELSKVNPRVTIHNEIIQKSIKSKLNSQGIPVTKNYVSQSTKSTASVGNG